MPVTTVSLTVEEYQGIIDRLAALEAVHAAIQTDLAPLAQRVQSVESTSSAMRERVASIPSLDVRLTKLEQSTSIKSEQPKENRP